MGCVVWTRDYTTSAEGSPKVQATIKLLTLSPWLLLLPLLLPLLLFVV